MIRDSVVDWQELSQLYERADALDPPRLSAWLSQLRDEQHRLLRPLERMLAARTEIASGTFLEALPRIETPAPPESEWTEGSRIGAYRLIRHIGSGGMAEVWLADRADGAFTRQVAIKLLFNHPSRAQRDSFVERFRRERDILASLSHPNIAALHDAGVTPSGQPWLALEYVEGEPVTDWCNAAGLGLEARIAVFAQVLGAVEHAHANLVIHRDLKPSNILVTAQGEVKLLDFGIAKLLDADANGPADTELTRETGRPLTILYASPEQIEGRPLTTASDVYSAGVVLYELVSGHRPYETAGKTQNQIAAIILSVEPKRPSSFAVRGGKDGGAIASAAASRSWIGDLDAVVMKALRKEPADRYRSAEAMAADLRRWRERRPVEARVPSAGYRARRFVMRHRLGVSLASGAVVALVTVATVAVLQGLRAREESARAITARAFVQDIFRIADPDQSKDTEITTRKILARGRANAERMFVGQQVLLAEVLSSIGEMQVTIGDHAAADPTWRRVVELFDSSDKPLEAAKAQAALAENALLFGQLDKSEQEVAEARRRASAFPGEHELAATILFVESWLSNVRGQPNPARELMLEAKGHADAVGPTGERALDILQGLAEIDVSRNDLATATAWLEEAERRAQRNPGLGGRARTKIDLSRAWIETRSGRYEALLKLLERVIPACDQRLGSGTLECAILRQRRVAAFLRTGRIDAAVAEATQLLAARSAELTPRRSADLLIVAVDAYATAGALGPTGTLLEELAGVATSPEQSPTYRSIAATVLSQAAIFSGDPADAVRLATQALSEQSAGVPAERIARAKMALAMALELQGRLPEANETFAEAMAMFASAWGERHPLTVLFRLNGLGAWRATGQAARVSFACTEAAAVLPDALGREAPAMQRVADACREPSSRTADKSVYFF